MSKWIRLLGLVSILTLASFETASAYSYGTCTGFYGPNRKCQAETTLEECCSGVEIQCSNGQSFYGGIYWTPYDAGSPQHCLDQ